MSRIARSCNIACSLNSFHNSSSQETKTHRTTKNLDIEKDYRCLSDAIMATNVGSCSIQMMTHHKILKLTSKRSILSKASKAKIVSTAAGFEPTLPKEIDIEEEKDQIALNFQIQVYRLNHSATLYSGFLSQSHSSRGKSRSDIHLRQW